MSKPVVLVTTATSRNGREASKHLLATETFSVRLGARDSKKLASNFAQGAETVTLDLFNLASTIKACAGADYVYTIIPPMFNVDAELTMFETFLTAAKQTHIKHIVYLSAVDVAPPDADFKTIHNHYGHEQLLLNCGIPWTILRPSWFHDNIVAYESESIKWTGKFMSSAGDGVWTSVAVRDIAAVAARVLSNPGEHAGKIYTLETEALTDDILAEKITKAIGKKVTHVNLTPEEHTEVIKNHYLGSQGVNDFAAAMILLDKNKRESRFSVVRNDLELLLGRKGISVDEYLGENAHAFKMQEHE